MKKLQFKIDIHAPAEKVFRTMLDKETYKQWTTEFDPTSFYEGSWEKGSKVLFIAISKAGKRQGMVGEILEHIPNKFVSIRHYGILDGDNEITEGEAVKGWAGALENYSFDENNGITTVTVDVDTNEEHLDYFNEAWVKALDKLKELVEKAKPYE